MQAELPGPAGFGAATQYVRPADMADAGPWGPEVQPSVAQVRTFADAGYSRIAMVQVGPDQERFCHWYASTLKPALVDL